MPWELTIVNAKDRNKPLGERSGVIARIAAALPGVVLEEAPGPDPEMIAQMPPSLREHFMRPRPLNADFEGSDFSIQFYAENEPQIKALGVEVRGEGSPVSSLAAICVPNGWALINNADDMVVDLAATNSAEWEEFRAWRDKAVASLKSDGVPGE
jgi:hypothetical protein